MLTAGKFLLETGANAGVNQSFKPAPFLSVVEDDLPELVAVDGACTGAPLGDAFLFSFDAAIRCDVWSPGLPHEPDMPFAPKACSVCRGA